MEYNLDKQVGIVLDLIDSVADQLVVTTEGMGRIDVQYAIWDACKVLRELMADCLVCLKHPGLREEQEWRIVCRFDTSEDGDRLKYRATDIPYVELDCASPVPPWLGRLPIAEVWIGPRAGQQAEKEVRALLDGMRYFEATISRSEIPLRA